MTNKVRLWLALVTQSNLIRYKCFAGKEVLDAYRITSSSSFFYLFPSIVNAAVSDPVLPVEVSARRVLDSLSRIASYTEIRGGRPLCLLSSCTIKMKSTSPACCTDKRGVDRIAIHEAVNDEMSSLFTIHLSLSNNSNFSGREKPWD